MSQGTITTDQVIKHYQRAFKLVYGYEPRVYYLRQQWYRVNGELVHHRVIMDQIAHLRYLARKKRMKTHNRTTIQRLIDKLRGL